jgi:t-SNARE complex subunit (syntaxin)
LCFIPFIYYTPPHFLGGGIAALKEMAEAMGEELDAQDQMLKEVDQHVVKAQNDLSRLNKNVNETLKEQAQQNVCIYLICCIVLLGVLMIGYNLIKSATGSSNNNN